MPKSFTELTPNELQTLPWWNHSSGKQLAVQSHQEIIKPIDGPWLLAYVQDTDGNWYRQAW